MLLLIDPTPELAEQLTAALPNLDVHRHEDVLAAQTVLERRAPEVDVLVLGPALDIDAALDAARKLHEQYPGISIVLSSLDDGAAVYRAAMRAGASDLLPWDADADEVREVTERASAATRRLRDGGGAEATVVGTTIATFSTKGGVGKSFLATNIAAQLATTHPGEVCLIDLDLQAGDVAIMLQLAPERGILEVSEMGTDLDEQALAGYLTPAVDGTLRVLAAPTHPVHAERISGADVTRVLGLLRRMFRFVVIDGPPSFTEHVLVALEQVDTVVVVSSLDVPSIKNLRVSIETLAELGITRDRLRLVLNRADSKVGLTIREVERSLGTTIDLAIPSSREVPYAVNQGLPIVTTRPKAPVSKSIIDAVDRLAGSEGGERRSLRRRG